MAKILRQEAADVVKIVLFGPESTGKTTLSQALAQYYNTQWVPEFARDYLQEKWDKSGEVCQKEDIMPIAVGQMQLENQGSKTASKVLICDTDILETLVYSEVYYDGYADPLLVEAASANTYDLYLLTYIDTPWEADDLRDRPNQREEMFQHFEEALIKHNRPYILMKGDKKTRLLRATGAIDAILARKGK